MPLLGTLGADSARIFGFAAIPARPPGQPSQPTAAAALNPSETISTVYDIPYGSNFLQKVDLVVPTAGTIKGVIIYIHGGGWTGGAKSSSGFNNTQGAYTNNDEAQVDIVAQSGYVVVNCNYRLVGVSTDYGSDGTGGYPNSITDIQTILNYCTVSGAGAGQSSSWATIYNYIQLYGFSVMGYSAGGHLAIMAVGNYGTSSGIWPKSACSISGPQDLVFNGAENQFNTYQQSLVNAFAVPSDPTGATVNVTNLQASSPRYQYFYNGVGGPWYTALNASTCKFYFIDNNNDTLTPLTSITPFVNSLPVSRHNIEIVTEGSNSVPNSHNYTTSLSAHLLDFAAQTFTYTPTTSALVTYTKPTSDGGATILYYKATAFLVSVNTNISAINYGSASGSVTVQGLTVGTTYTFEVLAHNGAGDGPYSTASTGVTTYTVPGAPTIGTVTYTSGSTATVAFTAPGSTGGTGVTITGYTVVGFISGVQIAEYDIGTTSPILVTGLIGGQSYTFKVFATNNIGPSALSSASTAIAVKTAPDPPYNVAATNTSTVSSSIASATITFTAPANNGGNTITSYTVTAFTVSNDTTTGLTASGTPAGATFSGLTKGVAYYFRVTATNSTGTSIYSAPSSSTTLLTVPVAPTIGTLGNVNSTTLSVSFTAPTDNGGSTILSYTAVVTRTDITATLYGTLYQAGSGAVTITGAVKGGTYTAVVYATNSVGNSANSGISNTLNSADFPGAPTITSVTTQTTYTTTGQVTVNFTAPSDNGGATIDTYYAYAYIGSTNTGIFGSVSQAGSGSILVTGLTKGQAYTFIAYAHNRVGLSQPSATSSSITPLTVPGTGTMGTIVATSNTTITVPFSLADNGGQAITQYTITLYNEPANTKTATTFTGTSSPITATGLTQGSSYAFTVIATNFIGSGAESSVSNTVATWTNPNPPTSVSATFSTTYITTTTSVSVSFVAPVFTGNASIVSYTATAYISGVIQPSLTNTSSSSPISISGLTKGTTYTIGVYATNGLTTVGGGSLGTTQFNSTVAQSANVTPVTVPDAPTIGTPTTVTSVYTATGVVSVYFTAPTDTGGQTLSTYTALSTPGSLSNTGASSPISVSGLTKGTSYQFQARASNASGNGAYSSLSTSIVPYTPPGTPSAPSATPTSGTTATATASIPSDTGGSPITLYTLSALVSNTTGGPYSATGLSFTSSTTAVSITGLTAGKYYVFTETATNIYGTSTASGNSTEISPADPPGAPTITSINQYGSYTSDGRLIINFTAPASNGGSVITSYTATDSTLTFSGTVNQAGSGSITITGLTKGTSYSFTVKATNRIGSGPASNSVSQTPYSVPVAPTVGTVTYTATAGANAVASIPVSDSDSGGLTITSYTATSSPGSLTGTLNASSGNIIVSGLTKGTSYTFSVTATNSQGTSSATGSNSITPYSSPSVPYSLTASVGQGGLDSTTASLSWNAPSDTGGAPISTYTITNNYGAQTTSTTTSKSFTGLNPASNYYWTITATNTQGLTSASSSQSNTIAMPFYTAAANPTSVNETSNPTVNVAVSTLNVPNGTTLYWSTVSVSGSVTAAEFTDGSLTGSFTITGGSGSFTRTQVADHLTQGNRSWYLQIRIISTSGTVETDTSAYTVTVTDTSLTYGVVTVSPSSQSFNIPSTNNFSYTSSGSFVVTMSSGTPGNVTISPFLYSAGMTASLSPSSFSFTALNQTQTVNYSVSSGVPATEGTATFIYVWNVSLDTANSTPTFQANQTQVQYTENITVSPTSGYTTTTFTYTVSGAPGSTFYTWNNTTGYSQHSAFTLSGSAGGATAGTYSSSAVYWISPGTYTVYVYWLATGDGDPNNSFSPGYATHTNVSVTVTYPPVVVSASPSTNMTGQLNQPFTGDQTKATGTASVSATGGSGSGYTYAVTSGALPGGVTFSSSGIFGGSPTATNFFNVTITATDGAGVTTGTISISFAIINQPVLTITGNTANVTSGNIETVTWTSTGTSGVNIVANGINQGTYSSNGSFPITYTVASQTTYSGTITPIAVNGVQVASLAQNWSWTVYLAPTINLGISTSSSGSYTQQTATGYATGTITGALYYAWQSGGGTTSLIYYLDNNTGSFVNQGSLTPLTSVGGAVEPLSATTYTQRAYIIASNPAGTTATSQTVTGTFLGVGPVISSYSTPSGSQLYPGAVSSQSITGTWFSSASANQYGSGFSSGSGNQNSSTITYTLTVPSTAGNYSYVITVTGPYGSFTATQTISITVSKPPAPVINSFSVNPTSGNTSSATTTVSWSSTCAGGFSSGGLYINGALNQSISQSGSVSFGPNIAVGTYNIYVTITDSLSQSTSSSTITYNEYTPSGTYISQFCSGFNLYYTYANGSGGTYNQLQQTNSPTCGYVPPPTLSASYSTYSNDGGVTYSISIPFSTTNATSTSSTIAGWPNTTSGTYDSTASYGSLPPGSYGSFSITATGSGGSVTKSVSIVVPGSGTFA